VRRVSNREVWGASAVGGGGAREDRRDLARTLSKLPLRKGSESIGSIAGFGDGAMSKGSSKRTTGRLFLQSLPSSFAGSVLAPPLPNGPPVPMSDMTTSSSFFAASNRLFASSSTCWRRSGEHFLQSSSSTSPLISRHSTASTLLTVAVLQSTVQCANARARVDVAPRCWGNPASLILHHLAGPNSALNLACR
jgi:hypothetical protein